jgi:DNA invertase Pin-like site-specific DNA recombinase
MQSRIDFICCDNPHANRLMLHMLAAFAEHEREMISIRRTRDVLAAAKVRGKQLGSPKIAELAGKNREGAIVCQ